MTAKPRYHRQMHALSPRGQNKMIPHKCTQTKTRIDIGMVDTGLKLAKALGIHSLKGLSLAYGVQAS